MAGSGRDLGRYAAGARRARTQRGPRHLRPSGRARALFSHRIEKPVIPPCMPCFAMPHEGEADQLCTTPCISHGHTQLQRQTNQKELAHTSSSTAHPPAAIPHYPHGRFTSRMPTHRPHDLLGRASQPPSPPPPPSPHFALGLVLTGPASSGAARAANPARSRRGWRRAACTSRRRARRRGARACS